MPNIDSSSIYIFDSLESTNIKAAEFLSNETGLRLPCLIAAKTQTRGRGQRGTHWESPLNENIYASLVLDTSFIPIENQFLLSKIVAIGCQNFLKNYIQASRIRIKWPNDIYVDARKIVGILIENKIMALVYSRAIVGIGINFYQEKFSENLPNPTSVFLEKKNALQLPSLEEAYVGLFEEILKVMENARSDQAQIHAQYLQNLLYYGQMQEYVYKGESVKARMIGVDTYGHLQLETIEGEMISADLKEITYLLGKSRRPLNRSHS